jgi:predicted metal-dependent hydrolase
LEAGRFKLLRSDAARGREHFVAWYKAHALPWLRRRVKQYAPRIGAQPARVEVRDLGHRWGSCGQAGGLNFHWATILLPAGIVDYVVVHELAHLREPNHTPEFWTRVERVLPDYRQRKEWLAANGAGSAGL